jgi:hypothetical protein
VVLAKGAFHTATTLRGPAHVAPVPFPPSSPAPNPIARLWRDLQDQRAPTVFTSVDELSATGCRLIQGYSRAPLKSLTGFAYFTPALETGLRTANG